jgi:hypothetical protein
LSLQIKGLLEKNNVTTASFRGWEDKDRLKTVTRGLEVVCEQSTALLSEQQREDAAKCAKYLAERDALDQLIGLQRKKEVFDMGRRQFEKQVIAKRSELTHRRTDHANILVPVWQRICFVMGGLAFALGVVWLLVFCITTVSETAKPLLPVPDVRMFLLLLFSIGMVLIAQFTSAGARRTRLTRLAKALETEIANAEGALSRYDEGSPIKRRPATSGTYAHPSGRDYERERERIMIERGDLAQDWATQDRMDELHAMFGGDLSSEACEAVKRERDAFIEKVFGAVNSALSVPEGAREEERASDANG